jgi:1-acyl-sn-glycerol-3-phosphate acyltransferase
MRIFTFIRNPFIIVFTALWTALVASTQAILYPVLSNYWRRNMVGIVWSEGLLKIAGVRLRVTGREHIRDGAVYLFNHTSHYDIPISYAAVRRFLRFGAKESLFKVPFLALGMRNMKVIPIDRANREKVLASYRKIYPEVKNEGDNVILAPEGTRQTSEEIGPFKNGPFIFAVECGVPLIPVVIAGASQVLGKKSLWINKNRVFQLVQVKILPPVDTKGWTTDRVDELKEKIRSQMIAGLKDAQKERAQAIDPNFSLR